MRPCSKVSALLVTLLVEKISRSLNSYKKLTDWARQIILQLRRWLPSRPLVVVADSSYAVLDLLSRIIANTGEESNANLGDGHNG